jgi:hypothetical protein
MRRVPDRGRSVSLCLPAFANVVACKINRVVKGLQKTIRYLEVRAYRATY